MAVARTPTMSSSHPCSVCGSFLFKDPDMVCFWCRKPRTDIIAERRAKAGKASKWLDEEPSPKKASNKWLD
jgi:uncharacterized Zn finger protein (UPF0148 family)